MNGNKRKNVLKFLLFSKRSSVWNPENNSISKKFLKEQRNDMLYGFLFVDIHTPDELKPKFADFPMIIKNAMISLEGLSPYMLKITEEQGYLKKPRQYLISSYFGKNFLINSKMEKFYLSLGLVITEIQEFVIRALTKKLLGNSLNVIHHQNDIINQAINNSFFTKWTKFLKIYTK